MFKRWNERTDKDRASLIAIYAGILCAIVIAVISFWDMYEEGKTKDTLEDFKKLLNDPRNEL